jgi:hypothetical protein
MPRSAAAVATPVVGWSIAERAYFKSERRGFAPGYELEDWLAAEREVAALLAALPVAKPKRKTTTRAKSGAEKAPVAKTAAAKAAAAKPPAAVKTTAAKAPAARPK